jgi:hypothetical protein
MSALSDKLTAGGIFCYLAKASECLNHDTLLFKLKFYGITDKAKKWIKSYLKDR